MPEITTPIPGQRSEAPASHHDLTDAGFMSFDSTEFRSSFDQVPYPAPESQPDDEAHHAGFMFHGSTEFRSSFDQVAYSAPEWHPGDEPGYAGFMYFGSTEFPSPSDQVAYSETAS
jgi:hypothetical protein